VDQWLPTASRANRFSRWLPEWVAHCEHLVEQGDRDPLYAENMRRWCAPNGHIGFYWWKRSIFSVDYASLQAWDRELAKRTYRVGKQERKLSPKSRHNIMGAMHSMFSWLLRAGVIVAIPPFPWPRLAEYAPTLLSASAQRAVLDAIPEDRRGIFLAQALLGLRPKEARNLRAADYQPADGDEPPWLTVPRTKTGRVKRLPVPPELEQWIDRHVPSDARLTGRHLFVPPPPKRGGRVPAKWSKSRHTEEWNRACRKVGISCPMYEGTKHTRATELVRAGIEERLVQLLLGHADVRSTRRYARLAPTALVEVIRPRQRG